MLDFIANKSQCVGCSACLSSCPTKCIKMIQDGEGFFYPEIVGNCIGCGKCERVCPIKNPPNPEQLEIKIAYAGVTKDKQIWQRSASGGAFSEICRAWDNGDTLFSGACWNGLNVQHDCVIGFSNIAALCKSKYVASDVNSTFSRIKNHLDSGGRALFCGTPCQISGLRNFLGKEYSELFLVDLICHGVGSPKVFQTSMEVLGDALGGKVLAYEFRAKGKSYNSDHIQKIETSNIKSILVKNDPYIQLFLSQHCLRPSCGKNCRYRNERRQGDITIADFKRLVDVFPDLLGTKQNYSSIVINTEKGKSLIEDLQKNMELYMCSVEYIKKYNPLFYRQTFFSENRDVFFAEYQKKPYDSIKKYTQPVVIYRPTLKKKIWAILPKELRKKVAQIIGGGLEPTYSECGISMILYESVNRKRSI